jgi:hypothetical protein
VGGSGSALLINDSAADLGDKFLAALNAIRGSALPCELNIPRPSSGTIDYAKVNVRYNGAAGPDDLRYVGSAAGCDPARGGWYYDTDPAAGTPTTIRVLRTPPASASAPRAAPSSSASAAARGSTRRGRGRSRLRPLPRALSPDRGTGPGEMRVKMACVSARQAWLRTSRVRSPIGNTDLHSMRS